MAKHHPEWNVNISFVVVSFYLLSIFENGLPVFCPAYLYTIFLGFRVGFLSGQKWMQLCATLNNSPRLSPIKKFGEKIHSLSGRAPKRERERWARTLLNYTFLYLFGGGWG